MPRTGGSCRRRSCTIPLRKGFVRSWFSREPFSCPVTWGAVAAETARCDAAIRVAESASVCCAKGAADCGTGSAGVSCATRSADGCGAESAAFSVDESAEGSVEGKGGVRDVVCGTLSMGGSISSMFGAGVMLSTVDDVAGEDKTGRRRLARNRALGSTRRGGRTSAGDEVGAGGGAVTVLGGSGVTISCIGGLVAAGCSKAGKGGRSSSDGTIDGVTDTEPSAPPGLGVCGDGMLAVVVDTAISDVESVNGMPPKTGARPDETGGPPDVASHVKPVK